MKGRLTLARHSDEYLWSPSGVVPVSAGVSWAFHATSDAGAFVMLNPPGVAEEIQSRLHIVNYVNTYFQSWFELANSTDERGFGLDLREEDIIFVCGTLKTTEWVVAAFQGNIYKDKEGSVSAQFDSVGSVGLSVHIADQRLPASHYRAGPPRPAATAREEGRLLGSSDTTLAAAPPDRSQCLFIHYYKMKRRLFLWKRPMQAAAGPHNLPPGPDNTGQDDITASGGPSAYEFESEPFRDDVRPSMFIESTGC